MRKVWWTVQNIIRAAETLRKNSFFCFEMGSKLIDIKSIKEENVPEMFEYIHKSELFVKYSIILVVRANEGERSF